MLGLLATIFGWILRFFIKEPSQETVQATKAATAETELQGEVTSNAKVQKAVAEVYNVNTAVTTDVGLHNYESKDPNNRDNSSE